MAKIGLALVGNSPRGDDFVDEFKEVLPPFVEVVQKGALDKLSKDDMLKLSVEGSEPHIVTILKDGSSIVLSKKKIVPLIQKCIGELEDCGVEVNVLICTGSFPNFTSNCLLIKPQEVLYNLIKSLVGQKRLGVFIPLASQISYAYKKWNEFNIKPVVVNASPYSTIRDLKVAAEKMEKENVDLVVMDCFGYNGDMKKIVQEILQKPVILARTMIARIVAEILLQGENI